MSVTPKNKIFSQHYNLLVVPASQHTHGRPFGGLILGWDLNLGPAQVTILKQTDHYILIKLSNNFKNLLILFFYLSPDKHYHRKLGSMFEELTQLSTHFGDIIVMGDANAWTGQRNTILGNPRNSKDARVNTKGKALLKYAEETGLAIGNGALNGDLSGEVTFISSAGPKGGSSVIDLLLYSPTVSDVLQSFSVLDLPHSSHFPILTKLSFLSPQMPNQPQKSKIFIPKDTEKLYTLKLALNHNLASAPFNQNQDPTQTATVIEEAVKAACKGMNLLKSSKPHSHLPKWFDPECAAKKYEKLRLLRHFRRIAPHKTNRRAEALDKYKIAKTEYLKLCEAKAEQDRSEKEACLYEVKEPLKYWKAVKSLRNPPAIPKSSIPRKTWHTHFNDVFNPSEQRQFTPPTFPQFQAKDEILDAPFNIFELQLSIKKLKNSKAPGPDLIPNEVWKLLTGLSLEKITNLFQKVYDCGEVPAQWCQSLVTPLYKKGQTNDPENYRPISLLNTLLKLFTTILVTRFNNWMRKHKKLSKFQAGFRRGKNTLDHIFILSTLIQKQLRRGEKLYACFVDLKQAFDTPNHNLMWSCLLDEKVSQSFIKIFRSLYAQASTRINTGEGPTEEIKITKGVLQGESASPSLFNAFIEGLSRVFDKTYIAGIRISSILIHHLLYADDLVILAPSAETLQQKMTLASNFFHSRALQVNHKKTQVVVFSKSGRTPKSEKFSWRKVPIQVVKEYTYLGVIFSSNGRFQAQATSAVSKGHAASAALTPILKFPRNFSLLSTKKLLTSILLSTTLYGAGIWGHGHAEQLEATQQRYLKRVLGLPISTPKYFLRLELGIPHVALSIGKLAYAYWLRILSAKETSLIRAAYNDQRKAAASPSQDCKGNWCAQLGELLESLDLKHVWNKNSYNFAQSHYQIFLAKYRAKLGADDVESAEASTTMPHYHNLIKSDYGAKFYLTTPLPQYAVRRIAQIRLNRNTVLNQGQWVNLGDFKTYSCRFCGDELSLKHILQSCTGHQAERQALLNNQQNSVEDLINTLSTKILPTPFYKALHVFLCKTVRKYE